MRRNKSLLTRKESKRSLKKAIVYSLLTIILGVTIYFLGIPALIKLAVFLGNFNSASKPVEQSDKIPPTPPIFNYVVEATNSSQLTISGFAENGSNVQLFISGNDKKESVADAQGEFSFPIKLDLGKNEFYAIAVDNEGNQSIESENLTVSYDNEAPSLEITEPEDGATFWQDKAQIEIKGVTDPEATILIKEAFLVVDRDGTFSYKNNLQEGSNEFTFIATDPAGNQTEKTIKLNYSP